MSFSGCNITANPDISGIGVRTAMYAQAVLTLIQPSLASLDGHISADELVGLHTLYLGILLPGCALLFSAVIQARTFGLSAYHGMIVLNLSWINNTSALIFFQFALIAQLKLDKERDFRRRVGDMLLLLYDSLGSLVGNLNTPGSDRENWNVAIDRARRMKLALEIGIKDKKFEGSREILENVFQGLDLLELRATSSSGRDQETKAINDLVARDRIRLPRSLGTPVDPPASTIGLLKAVRKIRVMGNKCAKVAQRIPGGAKVIPLLRRDLIMATLASAHLTLFAAFGLWVWFKVPHFGSNQECEPFTNISLVVLTIPINSSILRKASIVVYFICLVPYINIVVFGAMEVVVIYGFQKLVDLFRKISSKFPLASLSGPLDSPLVLYEFIGLTLLVQAYFITSTELTIKNNGHLLEENEEAKWTFGQTLAVALIVIPMIQVSGEIWKNFVKWLQKKGRSDRSGGSLS